MGRTENAELTVLCLVRRGEEILLQNRVKKDWQGYALPGGHVEPGESVVEAVIREMREETGLTVLAPRLCGVKQFPIDGGRYLVFLFLADRFEGQLHSSAEGKMEWVPRSAVKNYPRLRGLEPKQPLSGPFCRFLPYLSCLASARRRHLSQKSIKNCSLRGALQFSAVCIFQGEENHEDNTLRIIKGFSDELGNAGV